ncbi:hypothetical protein RBQ61_07660 [Sedimentibacter sp. MB35-C1]|uniref:hypothetical protein n=1 Tax=Sedimentibacter sp. MB35-C1 TaxID=3070995 RepID=UPI0027E035FA|nr:hypothetical protein [Sedimentibacter sp. MB35-C1]WMJ78793.1 hypothetical protein RBQ61_07660 [Sedimentibacter sp. MB35-C1]
MKSEVTFFIFFHNLINRKGGIQGVRTKKYYSARTKLVDEDRVIENSADALRCGFIDMVFTNPAGDC